MKKSIYLDYAAATPMDRRVLRSMERYYLNKFYNPSASYLAAKAVKRDLDDARATVARRLGAKPAEIVFTAGATEANNIAIQGLMRQFPDGEILISAIEHDSVRTPAWLFRCREIPVTGEGTVRAAEVSKMIKDDTVLISLNMVNNEIGSLQPLKEIAVVIKAVRAERRKLGNPLPIYLHTDAAQAPSYFDLNAARLGVDMMSINGGKIYGPKQSGLLFVRAGVQLQPLLGGGGQESGLRAGTENVPAIIGLAAALDAAQDKRVAEKQRLTRLRKLFIEQISEAVPDARVNGPLKSGGSPHIINVSFPNADNERLMMELDEAGIQCSTGSACHASSAEPSHVLSAIGLSPAEAYASLRFSMGRETSEKDISNATAVLSALLSDSHL